MRNHFFFTQLSHPTSVTDAPGIPLLAKGLAEISEADWQPDRLKTKIKEIAAGAQGVENPAQELYHYLRKVLADGKDGASVADIMAILGRKGSLRRLGGDVSRKAAKYHAAVSLDTVLCVQRESGPCTPIK